MRRFLKSYMLGLVAASTLLSAAVAGSIGVLYVTQIVWIGWLNANSVRVCIFGACIGVLIWLVIAVPFRRAAVANSASAGTYGEICEELDRIAPRLTAATATGPPGEREQAQDHLTFLHAELGHPDGVPSCDLRWLLAHGYVDAWRRIHRIQEAVIVLDESELVVGDALNDELRLMSSQISQREDLLERLRRAVVALGAADYLCKPPAGPPESPAPGSPVQRHEPELSPELRAAHARAVLRQVRYAINDYRDGRRDGIVRARNNVFTTAMFTGSTATLLLIIAILAGAPPSAIGAAAAFYLVGGIVGLFKQLHTASGQDSATDDFGLGDARLLQTPLFSGLAAIGGVVLTSMVSAVIPVAGSTNGTTVGNVPSLSAIFNISQNPTALIIAGVFGLAPTLLIARLQQQAEHYKADLSSSQAAGKGRAPD